MVKPVMTIYRSENLGEWLVYIHNIDNDEILDTVRVEIDDVVNDVRENLHAYLTSLENDDE